MQICNSSVASAANRFALVIELVIFRSLTGDQWYTTGCTADELFERRLDFKWISIGQTIALSI